MVPTINAVHLLLTVIAEVSTVPKCVICNKDVKPGTEHKARYAIHDKCFKRVVPSAKEQKTGDEVI